MNKLFRMKYILILIIYGFFNVQLYAQKKAPPIFSSKQAQNNFTPTPGKFFAKLGILNLIHPTAPSLDVGIEYMLTEKMGLELMYGLRSSRILVGSFGDRIYFDKYFKLFGSFRFYPKGRGTTSIGPGSLVPSFLALEGYYSQANTLSNSNFALDNSRDDRLDYVSADIDKWVKGVHVKPGYIWKLSKRLGLETGLGVGVIFYRRDYVFFIPNINGQTFQEDLIGPYDDRNVGRVGALHLLADIKLTYKIF